MPQADLAQALEKLENRSNSLRKKILKNKSAKKFFKKSKLIAFDLRQKSSRILAGMGLVGALLTSPLNASLQSPPIVAAAPVDNSDREKALSDLQKLIPHSPTKLTPEEAAPIEDAIYKVFGVHTKAYLNDQSLNHTVGYMGFEQHLYRYPGDTLGEHDAIQDAGIAPGLGAFGYFAKTANSMSTEDYLREKYYCVVQTLYLPTWNQDFKFLRDWYMYRKVLVYNPVNARAVICDIGDAGPAEWTGKQFGGSPETMDYLGLNQGPRKGLITLLFVDDPSNQIRLGPVNY